MKILVLSDSHSSLRFMRDCVYAVKPDTIVHLGDHYDDAAVLREEYPHIRIYSVPGNCDRVFTLSYAPEVVCCDLDGVRCFMTHGHRHNVKSGTGGLIADAVRSEAKLVLYGHTHIAECREENGLWILNPGSCRGYGGSAGLVLIEGRKISSCRILRQEDLEMLSTVNSPE